MIEKSILDNLMIHVSQKDMSAFEKLYYELKGGVYGLGLIITKSPYDAEDIMQNTFIRVWDKAYTYHPGTDARAWTMKIARNLAITKYNEKKRFVELDFEIQSEDAFTQSINSQILEPLLSLLKIEEREIVTLYAMGFSQKEIAGIINKPYATVRWKYSNAIKKLSALEKEVTI